MNFIKNYFYNQIKEIKSSKALIYFGAFLSFSHVVNFTFFDHLSFYYFSSISHPSNICLQFISTPFCEALRFPSASFSKISFFIYLILALISIYCFLIKKIKFGFTSLLFLTLFKYITILMSLNHMGNYHYMVFIVSFLYLLFPQKKLSIPVALCLFYISAGLLKLNNLEWITGGSLWKIEGWSPYLVVFLTSSVIFLELFIAPCLLLKHKIKYLAFGAFCLFHIVSYYWVGYFYPLNCFAIISIFPLIWFLDKTHENLIEKIVTKEIPKSLFAVFVVFVLAQITPHFYKGDSSVTGEGRVWALDMYDARTACYSYMKVRYKNYTEGFSRSPEWLSVRIHCDPYVYYLDAKKACKWAKKNSDFKGVDFHLSAKRKSDLEWASVVKIQNFCAKNIEYNLFKKKLWINF